MVDTVATKEELNQVDMVVTKDQLIILIQLISINQNKIKLEIRLRQVTFFKL